MTPTKFSLAAIRVWGELLKSPEGKEFLSEELEITEKFFMLWKYTDVDYEMYTEYFAPDIELLDHSKVVRALVPEVAQEAGFIDFVETNCPISNRNTTRGHFEYETLIPDNLLQHYIANKRQWINSFVSVCMRNNTLPPMCEFAPNVPPEPDTDPYISNMHQSYFDRIAPLVVTWTKNQWLESFPHQEVTEEEKQNLEYFDLEFLENSRSANKKFLDLVHKKEKETLRFYELPERTYLDKNAPFRIQVTEACRDFWPKLMLLAFEMGCDVPIIEALYYVGAFDKK